MMQWNEFEKSKTLGESGSENGIIINDEEITDFARITLEVNSPTAPFAITCGIYGSLVHTVYCSTKSEADTTYTSLKQRIELILKIENTDDFYDKIEQLVNDF